MTRRILVLPFVLAAATLAGCDSATDNTNTRTTPGTSVTPPPPPRAPDNTGINKRDADGTTKTPMDQGNNQADIDITANIRRAIMNAEGMSTSAENCKIITEAGVVTLRGTVQTQAEKDAIARAATATTGVKSVVNELEVKPAAATTPPPR